MFKRTKPIQYIVLHYSASIRSNKGAAQSTVKTLDSRGYSSDFAVDDDVIIQFADDPAKWASNACQAWNRLGTEAGRNSTNNNSVSIEMSSTLDGGRKSDWKPNNQNFRFTQETLNNTAYLCKLLISKYNIPKDHIIRHFDIMGKCCPGIIGWNTGSGSDNDLQFRAFVDSLYDGTTFTPSENDYVYTDYQSDTNTGGGSVVTSNRNEKINIPGVSNKVYQLSSAGKTNENALKISETRKNEFASLRELMTNNAPQMGRDILITAELYDSNILKGSQESKTERK